MSVNYIRDIVTHKHGGKLAVFPNALAFHDTEVGRDSYPQTVVLTNTGNGVVRIKEIRIVGDFKITSPTITQLRPGRSVDLQVVFSPTKAGSEVGGLYINSGDAGGEEFIKLIGSGVEVNPEPDELEEMIRDIIPEVGDERYALDLAPVLTDTALAAPRTNRNKQAEILTPFDFTGANITIKTQNAVNYLATKDYGGTLHFPPGDYTFTDTITISGDNIHLAGLGEPDSVRILRASDFGPTFRFAKDNGQIMNGFGIHRMWLIDINNSMTAGASPYHIEFDYVSRGTVKDLLFSQGCGAILCKGVNQTLMSNLRGTFPVGNPAGRSAMLFTKTFATLNGEPVPYRYGGGIWITDCDMQGGYGPGDAHLDYGYEFLCGDGFWLTNVHTQWTKIANMRLAKIYPEQLTNIIATKIFLDMCDGHGLLVESGVAQRVIMDGVISCNQNGQEGKHGIYIASGGIEAGHFDVTIEGFKGAPVYVENNVNNTDVVFDFQSIRNCNFGNSILNGTGISPLVKTIAHNWSSIAIGGGDFVNVPLSGVTFDYDVTANMDVDTQGLILRAWVSSPDMVTVLIQNDRGFAIDLAAGNLTVTARRRQDS